MTRPSPSTVTDEGLVPSAYLKLWMDGPADANGCRCRVDLTEICEPWLDALKPTIVPLYTAEDAASGHTALLRRGALLAAWTDFLDANPDDVTSPEEYPDHALVTFDQMVGIIDAALSRPLDEKE